MVINGTENIDNWGQTYGIRSTVINIIKCYSYNYVYNYMIFVQNANQPMELPMFIYNIVPKCTIGL